MSTSEPRAKRALRLMKTFLVGLSRISFGIMLPSEIVDIFQELSRTGVSIDQRVKEASASLEQTSLVVSELQATIAESTKNLETIRQQYDRYAKLAAVELEKAKPVIQELENMTKRGKKGEHLGRLAISLLSGLIWFVLGIYLGPTLKALLRIG